MLNFSAEPLPRTRFNEQTNIQLELRVIAQTSIHKYIEAVVGLTGDMDGACAFFMPILIVFGYQKTNKRSMDKLPYREFIAMMQEWTREADVPYSGSFAVGTPVRLRQH